MDQIRTSFSMYVILLIKTARKHFVPEPGEKNENKWLEAVNEKFKAADDKLSRLMKNRCRLLPGFCGYDGNECILRCDEFVREKDKPPPEIKIAPGDCKYKSHQCLLKNKCIPGKELPPPPHQMPGPV